MAPTSPSSVVSGSASLERFCRCGTSLRSSNQGGSCGACETVERRRAVEGAPAVPLDFWQHSSLRAALASRHMGHIIRAYRYHPFHGRRPLSQERVARWMGLTQAQLSRIESGSAIVDLTKLTAWADALEIPSPLLWFERTRPSGRPVGEADEVNRNQFLRLTGAVVGAAFTPFAAGPAVATVARDEPDCAQWLALETSRRHVSRLHVSEIPSEIAARIAAYATGSGVILRDSEDCFSFAHPAFVDFYVAQHIFHAIGRGDSQPFANVQTTHETDLVIREFAERDAESVALLDAWMHDATKPVLRVNAGGVLSKLGTADDRVVRAVQADPDMRRLYLTAVIARVLDLEWAHAGRLADAVITSGPLPPEVTDDYARVMAAAFSAESLNQRDAAARWCSVAVLSRLRTVVPELADWALHRALRQETSRATLRSIGSVLGGNGPLSGRVSAI